MIVTPTPGIEGPRRLAIPGSRGYSGGTRCQRLQGCGRRYAQHLRRPLTVLRERARIRVSDALVELEKQAAQLGGNNMLMISASGTAVTLA